MRNSYPLFYFDILQNVNGFRTYLISTATREGARELINAVAAEFAKFPPIARYEAEAAIHEEITSKQKFEIHIEGGINALTYACPRLCVPRRL